MRSRSRARKEDLNDQNEIMQYQAVEASTAAAANEAEQSADETSSIFGSGGAIAAALAENDE